jgi:hypothetical protein
MGMMETRVWVFGAVAMLLAAGGCRCNDVRGGPEAWELTAGDTGAVVDARRDRDTAVDTTVDTTFDSTADVKRDAACIEATSFETSYFDIAEGAFRAPRVTDGVVYSERQYSRGQQRFRGVVRVEPETGEIVELGNEEGESRLVAASGGNALVARFEEGSEQATSFGVYEPGSALRVVGSSFAERWPGLEGAFQTGDVRPFDGRRLGLVLRNDPNEAPGWVGYNDGSVSREVHIQQWARGSVALLPDGFALSARTGPLSGGGDLEIFAYREREEEVERVTDTDAYEHSPVSTDEALFWNTNRGVYTAASDDLEPELIHRGTCSPVGADGRRAVFACLEQMRPLRTDPDRPVWGTELFYYDGEETRRIPTHGGTIVSPRIDGERVVWAEYDAFDNRNQGGDVDGTIRYWRVGASRPIDVDPVGYPCRGCATSFRPLSLSIGDDVIAWSHAVGEAISGEPAGASPPGGVAVVGDGCP